jgi:hypothetical protein
MRTILLSLILTIPVCANEKPIAYPVPSEFRSKSGLYSLALIPPKSDDPNRKETSHHAALRAKYSASGLYRSEDSKTPLWNVDWFDYDVHVSDDGVHAVRIHGENDQWRHYKTDKRLPNEAVEEQLAAPALTVYRNGEAMRTYSVRELVARPEALPHSMRYILWNAGGVFTRDGRQFVQMTQDERQVIFDLDSGRIALSREAGSKNAQEWVMRLTLAIVGTAIVAMLGIYLYHLRKKGPSDL